MSVAAPPKHTCVRCGRLAERAARTADGGICRRCYSHDPARMEQCSTCGRSKVPSARTVDGKALCGNCARPKHVCSGCGRIDHAKSATAAGPLCQRCYKAPLRACGKCGEVRPVAVRAQEGVADLCHRCAHTPENQCGICAKICPVHTHWPLGAVCVPCYKRSTKQPARCSSCGAVKVLIGRTTAGKLACGPCVGSTTDYVCVTCGYAGPQHYEGSCLSCSIRRLTRELLTSENGAIAEGLDRLPDILAQRGRPESTMRWLMKPRTQTALRTLASAEGPITHASVDTCAPGYSRHYLRALLVEAQILPGRDEPIDRLETWIEELTSELPARHAALIEPYARWGILRGARRHAARRGFTVAAADAGRERIRLALKLIEYVESTGRPTSELTQAVLDDWTAGNRERTSRIAGFVTWLNKRGIVDNVTIPRIQRPRPSELSDEPDHIRRIADLLDENSRVDLSTRVAGLLVLLYGVRIVQLQALTTADVAITADRTSVALAQHPIDLPEPIAKLVERLARQATGNARAQTPDRNAHFLFPGARRHEPIHSTTLGRTLAKAGIPTRLSRNYAMVALTSDLPAAVVATQLGLNASTTNLWARFGQRDGSEYLLARIETPEAQQYSSYCVQARTTDKTRTKAGAV
ncbi:hypothetical protein BH10ACT9_BH10ACT9_14610 [soil metagenome]